MTTFPMVPVALALLLYATATQATPTATTAPAASGSESTARQRANASILAHSRATQVPIVLPEMPKGAALYRSFKLPQRQAWGTVLIDLASGGWHLEGVDGPPADVSQLRSVLGQLATVEIGAHCAGWVDGATTYPCGFAIAAVELPGVLSGKQNTVFTDWTASGTTRQRLPGTDTPEFRASGLIAPVMDAPRFVSVTLPALERIDGHSAASAGLKFKIRAVSNPLVPSQFDRSSAMVILHMRPNVDLR